MNCRLVDSASRHATSRRNMQQVAKKLNMFNFVQQVDRRDFLSTQHATCCIHMQLVACATSCMSGWGLKRSSPNLACVITSWIPSTKNWAQSVKGFVLLPIYAKYTPPYVRCATLRMFTTFLFFQSPTAETPAWILTLSTSNDAVLRMDDPFECHKSDNSYLTEFLRKFEKIPLFQWGNL